MSDKAITRLVLENFTAFKKLDMELSPGVNILIGENGTGKTHILKALYSFCVAIMANENSSVDILSNNFFSSDLGSKTLPLHHKMNYSIRPTINIDINEYTLGWQLAPLPDYPHTLFSPRIGPDWDKIGGININSAFIPAKEMLAHGAGLRTQFKKYKMPFEKIYEDLLYAVYDLERQEIIDGGNDLIREIEKTIGGKVVLLGETFFLKTDYGNVVFAMVAEGLRKIATLVPLIKNGYIAKDSVLFWDEPEANLNPKLMKLLVEILLQLQRNGVQIFLATHNYVLLKEFDLQKTADDKVRYHSLFRNQEDDVECNSTEEYDDVKPNAILETFSDMYDRDVEKDFESD